MNSIAAQLKFYLAKPSRLLTAAAATQSFCLHAVFCPVWCAFLMKRASQFIQIFDRLFRELAWYHDRPRITDLLFL